MNNGFIHNAQRSVNIYNYWSILWVCKTERLTFVMFYFVASFKALKYCTLLICLYFLIYYVLKLGNEHKKILIKRKRKRMNFARKTCIFSNTKNIFHTKHSVIKTLANCLQSITRTSTTMQSWNIFGFLDNR